MSRGLHDYPYMLVTLLISLDVLYTLALHAKEFSGLGPGRNFHFHLAVQSRNVDVCTQRRVNETYGNVANNVQVLTHKDRMRLHLDDDVKISRGTPCGRAFPFIS